MTDKLRTLKNLALVSIATYIEFAIGLLLGVLLARQLGPEQYGSYAFAVWLSGLLVTLGNHALTISSIKFIAEARGRGDSAAVLTLQGQFMRLQSLSFAVVACGFVATAVLAPPKDWQGDLPVLVALCLVGAWSRADMALRAAIGKGLDDFRAEAYVPLWTALSSLLLAAIGMAWHFDVTQFLAAYAVAGLIGNLLARRWVTPPRWRVALAPLPPELRRRLRLHLSYTALVIAIATLGDRATSIFLLKAYAAPEVIGYFSIANSLTRGAVVLFTVGLSTVLLPSMSAAFGAGDGTRVRNMLREAMRLYWAIGLLVAGYGLTVAPDLVRLMYGHRYEPAIATIVVTLCISGLTVQTAAFTSFLIADDRHRARLGILATTLAVDAACALAWVPQGGLNGALVALCLSRLTALLLSGAYIWRSIRMPIPLQPMLRLAGATAAAVLVARLAERGLADPLWKLVAEGVAFTAVFAVASVLLRAWSRADFALMSNLMARRLPGAARRVKIASGRWAFDAAAPT